MQLDMIGLIVEDLELSLNFYRTLGLDVKSPEDDGPHVEYVFPNGLRLAWDTRELMESINGPAEKPVGHRVGIAFLCESPGDLDARFQRMIDAGYVGVKEPWDAFWGQRYAIVQDPDGNNVDLFCPLEA